MMLKLTYVDSIPDMPCNLKGRPSVYMEALEKFMKSEKQYAEVSYPRTTNAKGAASFFRKLIKTNNTPARVVVRERHVYLINTKIGEEEPEFHYRGRAL